MNKRRRMSLHAVLDDLARLRDAVDKAEAVKILQTSQNNVELCMDEEQDALDARPESFQWSTANDDMTENISDLSDVIGELEVLAERCNDMTQYSYDSIKGDVTKIVNLIKQVIHR